MSLLEELESLRIPFDDIKEATENFTTLIGKGGYGLVYKGELLLSGKLTTVAVKRLQVSVSGQGFKEFLTEIQLLTRYKHPNLISLVGFCYEGEEKILIYEYAENGSLDKYLSTAEFRRTLTWKRRLDICINAARGLDYLHNEAALNERVIHRDIKSANVLLDQNWKALISDLGLSKLGRANEKDTYLITNASGTYGYCDPVYRKSGILTKESDVYSFGVVLFEVLCGRLCVIDVHNEYRFLPELAQSYYKKRQINEIMDPELKNQLDSDSLNLFSEIAFKCIQNTRKQRPSMRWVLKKLEELQKTSDLQISSIFSERGDPNHPSLGGPVNALNTDGMMGKPSSSTLGMKMCEEPMKPSHSIDSETSPALLDASKMAILRQLVRGNSSKISTSLQKIQGSSQLTPEIAEQIKLRLKSAMSNPDLVTYPSSLYELAKLRLKSGMSNTVPTDPSPISEQLKLHMKSGMSNPGLIQGVTGLPLKGWPLTGIEQLRPGLGLQVHKPNMQNPNQFHLASQQQQVIYGFTGLPRSNIVMKDGQANRNEESVSVGSLSK